MKKFKDKLGKSSSSHTSMVEWTKHDDKILDYTENGEENKLRIALLKKGVSPLKKKNDGKTVIDVACERGNVECLEALLEKCAEVVIVSKAGCSALHTATKAGHASCVMKLLQYKIRVGCQDSDKMTALHHAASKGQVECVKVLLSHGAKLNIREKDGRTPLLIAIQAARENIVKLLLENGARVNLSDSAHKTPLMYASLIGLKDAVFTLLQHGANPLLRDTNGHRAEDFARISGYGDIVKMIENTPIMPTWGYAESYEDDVDSPSQDGSVVGSNEGSEVGSVLSHQDSEQGFGSVYPNSIRSSSHSLSTSVSSYPSPRYEVTVGRVKELEDENNRLNVQLRTLRSEYFREPQSGNITDMSALDSSQTVDAFAVMENGSDDRKVSFDDATIDLQATNEESRIVESLRKQVATLKIENERLRDEKDDINVDDSIPTIPITVYQQLKGSTEEVVSTLNKNLDNVKKENEILKNQLSEIKSQTQHEFRNKAEQKIHALEDQVRRLQKQLLEADNEHARTISIYRLHLLNAVQGDMDSDVKKALQLILKLRCAEQFC